MKKFIFSVLAFIWVSLFLRSEEKEKKEQALLQHEVVVTATRIETPRRELASSVTVISEEDLGKLRKTTLIEVLEDVLGLTVTQNGGMGSTASLFLRGANSEHTLVMIDGVELNDPINPSRSSDLAHFLVDDIERIEILRGPQSTLYGSDAIGGVVNIITKRGKGKPSLHFSGLGGSYGTLTGSLGMSGSRNAFHYSFNFSSLRSEGISAADSSFPGNEERDGYKNLTFSGRLGFRWRDNWELDFTSRVIWAESGIDNFGGPYGDDPNNIQTYNFFFLKGQVHSLFFRNRWEEKFSFSVVNSHRHHENEEDSLHPQDSESGVFKSSLFKIDWQNNLFLHPQNTLIWGLEYEMERGESEYRWQGFWGSDISIFPSRNAHLIGFYVQNQARIAKSFLMTAGWRLDWHSRSGRAFTFRLAPVYFLERTGTRFKATFGTGFKSPSLYQLYAPRTYWGPVGNIHLLPEKSRGWDIGLEQSFFGGKGILGITRFQNSFSNLIFFDFSQGYVNIGRAESHGWEFSWEAIPAHWLSFKGFYARTATKDLTSGEALLRRPKDKFSFSSYFRFPKGFALHLSLVHTGKREDMDYSSWPAAAVVLSGYTILSASVSYDLSSRLQLFSRFDNLLNRKYEMIYGYGTPGFSVYLGLKAEF